VGVTLPQLRTVSLVVAGMAALAIACTRHSAPPGPRPTRTATVAPAADGSALEGRVTVRIAWRGRPEPPRAAHITPLDAAHPGSSLEVTVEAPDLAPSNSDADESDDNADACQTLPAELRTRTFAATVGDAPTSADPMSVFAASPSSLPLSTPFRTVVVEGPTIQEQISPTTFLAIDGSGARSLATGTPTAVTMPWSGDFETCELRAPDESALGCGARPDQIVKRTVCHFSNGLLTIRRR
jgi:hypothetical protein